MYKNYLSLNVIVYVDSRDITLWFATGLLVQYFFSYKMGVYPFQNIPDNLDLSKKTDLEIRDYFGREKTHHLTELHEKPNLKPNQYSILF